MRLPLVRGLAAAVCCLAFRPTSGGQDGWGVGPGGGACIPAAVGLGEHGEAPASDALGRCGITLLRSAFPAGLLEGLLRSFEELGAEKLEALRHGAVRAGRVQTHLPFEPPFDSLPLLGLKSSLRPWLAAVLGEAFVLDLVTVVAVHPGAEAQEPHRDTALAESISVHVPLHPLEKEMAPLGMCGGTHSLDKDGAMLVMREALLWRPKNESSNQAKMRLFCGGRAQTEAFTFTVMADSHAFVRTVDSRLGAKITAFHEPEAALADWKIGDEITEVNGEAITGTDDWVEYLEKVKETDLLEVRVERPIPEAAFPTPARRITGAPLAVGDALMYDSRTWHWGMQHTGNTTRYAIYVVFKSSLDHKGVHPEATVRSALREAREGFQNLLTEQKKREQQEL